jgi:DNA polymerase III delta prime subunit
MSRHCLATACLDGYAAFVPSRRASRVDGAAGFPDERHFNIAGPCEPGQDYMIPPAPRLPQARSLVDRRLYFVVHAPRQTGKTTTLRALARELTAEGRYAALHFSCESAEPTGDNYAGAQAAVLSEIRERARSLPAELRPPEPWPDAPAETRLRIGLAAWARACPRPLVLFFDEIDALRGEGLRSVLRQLRAGYPERPAAFPASVALCGMRDVRDYKAASGGDPNRLGTSSPFNIKVDSLRLGDFTEAEMRALYAQHTAATGQTFTADALALTWEYTAGQPWLVNALAAQVVDRMRVPLSDPVSRWHIEKAKELLIEARATHLDSLVAKLYEPRVQRILEPMIAGDLPPSDTSFDDDLAYVRDLGLVATQPLRMANPIYQEVIVRVLGLRTEEVVTARLDTFVQPDGRLDFVRLLWEFCDFWREHGEILTARDAYHEAAPQLVIMAFLQRVVDGGGVIDREYGVGRGRIDLLIRWFCQNTVGHSEQQREALELKVWRKGARDPIHKGLSQLDEYLDRLGLLKGTLVIFDRRPNAPPISERISLDVTQTPSGRDVLLLRA